MPGVRMNVWQVLPQWTCLLRSVPRCTHTLQVDHTLFLLGLQCLVPEPDYCALGQSRSA